MKTLILIPLAVTLLFLAVGAATLAAGDWEPGPSLIGTFDVEKFKLDVRHPDEAKDVSVKPDSLHFSDGNEASMAAWHMRVKDPKSLLGIEIFIEGSSAAWVGNGVWVELGGKQISRGTIDKKYGTIRFKIVADWRRKIDMDALALAKAFRLTGDETPSQWQTRASFTPDTHLNQCVITDPQSFLDDRNRLILKVRNTWNDQFTLLRAEVYVYYRRAEGK